jgi:hypothetical protein
MARQIAQTHMWGGFSRNWGHLHNGTGTMESPGEKPIYVTKTELRRLFNSPRKACHQGPRIGWFLGREGRPDIPDLPVQPEYLKTKVSENELTKGMEKILGFGQKFLKINKYAACTSDKIGLLHLGWRVTQIVDLFHRRLSILLHSETAVFLRFPRKTIEEAVKANNP